MTPARGKAVQEPQERLDDSGDLARVVRAFVGAKETRCCLVGNDWPPQVCPRGDFSVVGSEITRRRSVQLTDTEIPRRIG